MSGPRPSALAPLKNRTFAVMWAAAMISNIGTWMYAVGAGWLMTDLSPSPLVIALVQTATTLPVFLFALPAGALADIFNRRTLLLITNLAMLFAALLFALMVWQGVVSATILLLFTFLLGAGTAFMAPAWQAVIPRMVSRSELPQAVALGGISINLSRAIGPALAGLLITLYGITLPFVANAVSFVFIVLALLWWRYESPVTQGNLPPERVWAAMWTGARYAFHSRPLKSTMFHVLGFMFFANAYWGLLPILSKDQLQGDAAFFGALMGAAGLGAVAGAFLLARLKNKFSANQLVAFGTFGTALVTGYFAFVQNQLAATASSLVFGASWILVLSSVNLSAQQALPEWVRARGLAVFMMVFFGSMSIGAAFWGWLAGALSVQVAMLSAAAGGIGFVILSRKFDLQQGKALDLAPSHHWPEPMVREGVEHEQGPVMICINYEVAEGDRGAFLEAIHALKTARLRDGAFRWGVFEDAAKLGLFIETFMEGSWSEHLRHHERVTRSDIPLQEKVRSFHQGDGPPVVTHYLAANHAIAIPK